MKKIKRYIKKNYKIIALIISFLIVISFIGNTLSEILENDIEVEPNTELTYYLNVSYDGIDKNGLESNDTTIAEINSGTLLVEDKLPPGLTFTGFVTTDDGSIGAVKRSDGTTCLGKVVDDTNEASASSGVWNSTNTEYTYHGLHYDAATRKVSFKITNLKAGCVLTVGIKTMTPATIDDPSTPEVEKRRDFYNFATSKEKGLTINSNTTHAFMGKAATPLYDVNYEYTGTVPTGAPTLPTTSSYPEGSKVSVNNDPMLEGYTFSGWITSDVIVANKEFDMPNSTVTFRGSFTENEKYKVTYTIEGTFPEGYITPTEKNYYEGESVSLDSLKVGDVFNGYRFLGWTTEDVVVARNEFSMPSANVIIKGSFEPVKYKVYYEFYDTILPPNSENYLPETKEYLPGTIVALEEVTSPSGYEFLGWYKEDNFEMPEEDIIIYGEWKRVTGTFEPVITSILNPSRDYYRIGDNVITEVTIRNTASFSIQDIVLKLNTDKGTFITGSGYTVNSDNLVTISNINSNGEIKVYVSYTVGKNDRGSYTTEVELLSASATNGYDLKEKDYKTTTIFNTQSKLTVCSNTTSSYNGNSINYLITSTNYETWMTLSKDECESIYVDPGSYKIKEIVPEEYSIKTVTGAVSNDDTNFVIALGNDYTVNYLNQFTRKGFMHSSGSVVNVVDPNS